MIITLLAMNKLIALAILCVVTFPIAGCAHPKSYARSLVDEAKKAGEKASDPKNAEWEQIEVITGELKRCGMSRKEQVLEVLDKLDYAYGDPLAQGFVILALRSGDCDLLARVLQKRCPLEVGVDGPTEYLIAGAKTEYFGALIAAYANASGDNRSVLKEILERSLGKDVVANGAQQWWKPRLSS